MQRHFRVVQKVARLVMLAGLLAACTALPFPGQNGQPPGTPTPVKTAPPFYTATPAPGLPLPVELREAPALSKQVEAGQLPAVVERLPDPPKVVRPVEQVGVYGGTWRMAILPALLEDQFIRTVGYEPLVRWTTDGTGIEPNLVERYEVDSRSTVFTFVLRRGLRWSDGMPFTTEDIRFWYEDVLLNEELTPLIPDWLAERNGVGRFEFIDDVTFQVRFKEPNSLFLPRLATPQAMAITAFPAHYARRFHARYLMEDELREMLAEGGYQSWPELFAQRVGVAVLDRGQFVDPSRPRLSAWVLRTSFHPGVEVVAWERNPYYWKVDTQGNQLPYIDRVEFHIVTSTDEIITRALAGQVDMQNLSWAGLDLAVSSLVQERDTPVQFYQLEDGANNVMLIQFNLAHPDPNRRALFQNRFFRAGLSHATDRQSIIDAVLHSLGQPWQAAPAETSPFFDPSMAEQYIEYSLQRANDLLDRAGYRRDVLGSRVGPDGQPISFSILVADAFPQQVAMLNMIATQWAQVGVDVQPKVVTLPQFWASVRANQHDAVAWAGGSSRYYDVLLDPSNYLPFGEDTLWAVNWSKGYRKAPGFQNEQPVPSVRVGMDMYDRIRPAASTGEQQRLMKGALLVAREGFWTIGVARVSRRFGILLENFHNVPEPMPSGWLYPDPGPANPEQFFIAP